MPHDPSIDRYARRDPSCEIATVDPLPLTAALAPGVNTNTGVIAGTASANRLDGGGVIGGGRTLNHTIAPPIAADVAIASATRRLLTK
jgi:hypothetical protein